MKRKKEKLFITIIKHREKEKSAVFQESRFFKKVYCSFKSPLLTLSEGAFSFDPENIVRMQSVTGVSRDE